MSDKNYCIKCGTRLEERIIDGLPRPSCPAEGCGFVFWDNPVPVVAGLVQMGGMVILVRNIGWPEKIFGLVTGFLERDETPEQGIVREVREELGVDATIQGMIGVYAFTQKNQLILAYHLTAEGTITLNQELDEYRPVAPERLRPWPFGTGPAVRDWLESQGITPPS